MTNFPVISVANYREILVVLFGQFLTLFLFSQEELREGLGAFLYALRTYDEKLPSPPPPPKMSLCDFVLHMHLTRSDQLCIITRCAFSKRMAKLSGYLSVFFVVAFSWCILHASSVRAGVVKETRSDLSSLKSTSHGVEQTGTKCKKCSLAIDPSEGDQFKELVFREHPLAIFVFVTVGNASAPEQTLGEFEEDGTKNVSSHNLQVKQKWAWLRNKRGRFLATLPYDFDILSLTTLERETFTLSMNAKPWNCYANLSKNCLDSLIASTIIDSLTGANGNVCVRAVEIRENGEVKDGGYRCCERKNNSIVCDKPIENNQWIQVAIRFLWASSIGFGLFAPLLFKYLPKEFKKGPRIRPRAEIPEAETSSVDLVSLSTRPLLFALDGGMLDVLRTKTESVFFSRLSRCLFVILLSCLPLLQGFIYAYLKKTEVGISTGKLLGVGDAFITLMEKNGQFALSAIYCFCILLICIAIAIPRTLSDFARRLSGRRDERSFLGFKKPDEIICSSDKRGFQLLYENMIFHLNWLLMWKFWKFMFLVVTYPLQKICGINVFDDDIDSSFNAEPEDTEKRCKLCSKIFKTILLLLVFPIWAVTITTAFLLYIIPVTYVAFRVWKMLFRIEIESQCCQNIPSFVKITSFPILYILFIVFCMCVEASYFMLGFTLTVNIMFLGSVTGFTTMGLLFYIEVYLPYIVVGLWVVLYMLRATNKYYAQFTNLKTLVFEECEKFDEETRTEASIRESFSGPLSADRRSASMSSLQRCKSINYLVTVDVYGVPSIPLDIFLASSCQLMPFKRIMLAKFLKVIALGSYLVVILLFVMSLREFNAASPTVQGLALLFLGGLPLLALQSRGQSEAEEIRARFYVKNFIKQYTKRAL